MDSNSEIQGYNMYPMLHFCRKFSSSVTAPWSPVVGLVAYFGVVEVVKTEVLSGQVEESERMRYD